MAKILPMIEHQAMFTGSECGAAVTRTLWLAREACQELPLPPLSPLLLSLVILYMSQ